VDSTDPGVDSGVGAGDIGGLAGALAADEEIRGATDAGSKPAPDDARPATGEDDEAAV